MFLLVSKLLLYKNGDTEKARIFLLAPTAVAAINTNGTNYHSGFRTGIDGDIFHIKSQIY